MSAPDSAKNFCETSTLTMASPLDANHPVYPNVSQKAGYLGSGRAPFYGGSHFSPQNALRDLKTEYRYKIGQLETGLQQAKIQLAESKAANDFLLRSLVAGRQATDSNINELNAEIAVLKQQNLVLATKLMSTKLTLNRAEAILTLAKDTIRREKKKNAERLVKFLGKSSSSSNSLKSSTLSSNAPSSLSPGHVSGSSQPQGNTDSLLDFDSDQEVISPEKTLVPEDLTPPSYSNKGASYPFHHQTPDKSKEDPEQEALQYKVTEEPKGAKYPKLSSAEVVNKPIRVRQKHNYIHYSFAEDTDASSATPVTQPQPEPELAPLVDFGSAISAVADPISFSTSSGSESAHNSDSERSPKDSPEIGIFTEFLTTLQNLNNEHTASVSRGGLSASVWNNSLTVTRSKNLEQKRDGEPATRVFEVGLGASAWSAFAHDNRSQAVARGIQPPPLEGRPLPNNIRSFTINDSTQGFSTSSLHSSRSHEARRRNQPKDTVFDSPIEQQRAHHINQRIAGYSDLLDPAFFTHGLFYNPPTSALNVYRTVLIDNLPIGVTLTKVLGLITTGTLISAHLLDTRSITKSMTVYLVFLEEDSATALVKTQSGSPFIFHNRPARVMLLRTPTPPLRPLLHHGIFNEGWTRCVAITNAPKNFTPELCKSMISRAPLKRDWIVNINMRAKDAAIVIHFETLEAAEWALQTLRQMYMLKRSSVLFARDPCDGGFENDVEIEIEESNGEADAEADAEGGHEEHLGQANEEGELTEDGQ